MQKEAGQKWLASFFLTGDTLHFPTEGEGAVIVGDAREHVCYNCFYMSDLSGLLKVISEKFSVAGVRYALIGGFALHAAGYTRATGDIDFLLNAQDAGKAKEILLAMGYRIMLEDENVLNLEAPWQVIGGVDIIFARRQYTLDMLQHALPGVNGIPVIRPEGIIGLKVQAVANDPRRYMRDMADVEWLLKAHSRTMDMALIREYFALFGMVPQLEELLQRIAHA